jgi:hypothetical protein
MSFAMVAPVRPVSVQSKRGTPGFIASLRVMAATNFAGRRMLEGDLYARIIWFHDRQNGDVDNIIKPILDALEGVVYRDDRLIVKCSSERVDLRQTYRLSDAGVPSELYDELVALLGRNHPHILYVEVGRMTDRQVRFGPIDGGAL